MALLRYLKPRDGLPDPRGSLSSAMPSQAIAQANREVQEAVCPSFFTATAYPSLAFRGSLSHMSTSPTAGLPDFPKNAVATHAQSYASNFLMNPVLNFRGWSRQRKIFARKFLTAKISRSTVHVYYIGVGLRDINSINCYKYNIQCSFN